jgi:hypothetical protein
LEGKACTPKRFDNETQLAGRSNTTLVFSYQNHLIKFIFFFNYRVIGAVIIVGGLYCVLWAKGKETKSNSDLLAERSLARNLLHEESTYGSP